MKCILGIDIGTTTVKAVLYDSLGSVIHSAQKGYPIHYPRRAWVEQAPEDWWAALAELLRAMMRVQQGKQLEILAIGVSSQAPVFVALDAAGEPLDRAMIWMDRRAESEAELLRDTIGGEEILAYSRNTADPFYLAAKAVWFKKHKPEAFDRIHKIVQANGYVNYRLTGAITMDVVHAGLTQLYDVEAGTWALNVLKALQIPSGILPDVYDCSAIIGVVSGQAERETGLPAGIPVIAGTVDGAAAALEAGVHGTGIAVEMTGTSSVLLMSNDRDWYTRELITMNHALPNQTLNLAAMSSTGAALKWFGEQFYQGSAADRLDSINEEAEQANPFNDLVFLPYMMGERSPIWDTDARGVFFGLSLKSTRADAARAIMEGAACALRHNLEIMERSGERIQSLYIIGGAARSRLWNQIKADVLNHEIISIAESGGAPLGNALLAGMAVGFYPHPAYLAEHDQRVKRTIAPSRKMHQFYNRKYEIYLELYRQTKQQFKKLSSIFQEADS